MERYSIKNKKVLVVGAAETGAALAEFLTRRGARVVVSDAAPEEKLGRIPGLLRRIGARLVCGPHDPADFCSSDLVVLSPGVDHRISPVRAAREAGVEVIGEIELAARFISAPITAVTGTNGKTSVVRMITAMLAASGRSVFIGGNIGTPLIRAAEIKERIDVVVAEVSSFQLDTIKDFSPAVSVLLNVTEDHLDRYAAFDDYVASKARIFENQDENDVAILNAQDPVLKSLARNIAAEICWFNEDAGEGCFSFVSGNEVVVRTEKTGKFKVDCQGFPLPGRHNLENASAAALAALASGATEKGVQAGLSRFSPDPHRIEYVATVNGVKCYDDSKATNVDAVVKAVSAMQGRVVLIMGGRDKGGSYEKLFESVGNRLRGVVLMGEAAARIKRAANGRVDALFAEDMENAVNFGLQMSRPGDALLLSPACSSFDAYSGYAARGDDFKRAVFLAAKGAGK